METYGYYVYEGKRVRKVMGAEAAWQLFKDTRAKHKSDGVKVRLVDADTFYCLATNIYD